MFTKKTNKHENIPEKQIQVWWHTRITPAPERMKQEDYHEFVTTWQKLGLKNKKEGKEKEGGGRGKKKKALGMGGTAGLLGAGPLPASRSGLKSAWEWSPTYLPLSLCLFVSSFLFDF